MVVMQSDTDLAEMALALGSPSRFSRGLYRRQQQSHEDRDDGDHNQQLDQTESARCSPVSRHGSAPPSTTDAGGRRESEAPALPDKKRLPERAQFIGAE